MHGRSLLAVVAATALSTTLVAVGPARAGETRTLAGPATGDAETYLTYVRCDSLVGAGPATAPRPRINLGPYTAPLGRRSLGLVPTGPGSAAGPYAAFGSLIALDTSLSVAATGGSEGVSWVVALTPSSPRGTVWSGRAAVSVPSGGWTQVATGALTYEWTLVDLVTGAALERAADATPAGFAAEHGDGAGFAVTGFGCDGRPFNLDAVRGARTTFDFEGVALSTSLTVDSDLVRAGDEVAVTGTVTDASDRVTGDPLVLQVRTVGGGRGGQPTRWSSLTATAWPGRRCRSRRPPSCGGTGPRASTRTRAGPTPSR